MNSNQVPFEVAFETALGLWNRYSYQLVEAASNGVERPTRASLEDEKARALLALGWSLEAFNKKCKEEVDSLIAALCEEND